MNIRVMLLCVVSLVGVLFFAGCFKGSKINDTPINSQGMAMDGTITTTEKEERDAQ